MRPLTLQEFADQLRLEGNPFADEILVLCALERDVAEPHFTLCDDLDYYAPENLKGNPSRALEWIGDRSNLLQEIQDELEEAGREGDVDSVVKEMLATLGDAEDLLRQSQWLSEGGDFLTALEKVLGQTRPAKEYDL